MGLTRSRSLVVAAGLAVGLAACGSKRTPPATVGSDGTGDAARAPVDATPIDAAPPRAGTAAAYRIVAVDAQTGGRLRVKVAWPDARATVRRSPGRTACGGDRPPRARIGTLHGVANAVVIADVAAGKAPPAAADVRVSIEDCALAPPVIVAPGLGGAAEVQSQDEAAHHVTVTALGPAWSAPPTAARVAAAALPMIGHTVAVALAAPGVLRVVADAGADDDPLGARHDAAYVIAPPHPYVALTDDAGAADLDALPPGTYPVHAYLPAAAGQPALTATATAVVTAGQDTELTLTLAAPP